MPVTEPSNKKLPPKCWQIRQFCRQVITRVPFRTLGLESGWIMCKQSSLLKTLRTQIRLHMAVGQKIGAQMEPWQLESWTKTYSPLVI